MLNSTFFSFFYLQPINLWSPKTIRWNNKLSHWLSSFWPLRRKTKSFMVNKSYIEKTIKKKKRRRKKNKESWWNLFLEHPSTISMWAWKTSFCFETICIFPLLHSSMKNQRGRKKGPNANSCVGCQIKKIIQIYCCTKCIFRKLSRL